MRSSWDGRLLRRQDGGAGDGGAAAGGGEGEGAAAAAAAAAPAFVPSEEFKRLESTVTGLAESNRQLQESVRLLVGAAGRRPDPPPPAQGEVTEEQYLEAVDNRDYATVRRYNEQRDARLIKTHIEPLRAGGLNAIAGLTKQSIESKEHYKRFEKEINELIETMSPEIRIQPIAYQMAYDTVVGRHHGELVTEEREKALRQGVDPAQAGRPGSQAGQGREKAGGAPTPEELFDGQANKSELVANIAFKGGPDAFAKKLGHKDWKAYTETVLKDREARAA